MAFNKRVAKDVGILSIAVVLVQLLLSKYIYPMLGKTTQELFTISPQTAITSPTIGNKILGYISGLLPFSLGDFSVWIAMFIGTFLLLMVGMWVYGRSWAPKGKNIYQRLWFILLYGTAALYVVVLVTKMGEVATVALPLLIGLGINYLLVAVGISLAARYVKILRI